MGTNDNPARANGRAVFAFDEDSARDAAARWQKHAPSPERVAKDVAAGNYGALDTPVRLRMRAARLQRKAPEIAKEVTKEFRRGGGRRPSVVAEAASPSDVLSDDTTFQERIIGRTADFVSAEFFDRALGASRCVARVATSLGDGRVRYGTGFMVSPRLFLTNHHVLPRIEDASATRIQFRYQRDASGNELNPISVALSPETCYLADRAHDFALVAVAPDPRLAELGWCPLYREQGKIVVGEPVNIVQHPLGRLKEVVVRNNLLLSLDTMDADERFAWYEADTEPGSSGSPVFNNQWEVVALHHSSVPKRVGDQLLGEDGRPWKSGDDPSRLAWVANEGIRVSRVVAAIERLRDEAGAEAQPLIDELLQPREPDVRGEVNHETGGESLPMREGESKAVSSNSNGSSKTVTVTIPVRVTVTIGDADAGASAADGGGGESDPGAAIESVTPDPSDPGYARRPGYNPGFLGPKVPLPTLTAQVRQDAFVVPDAPATRRYELRYHHFSIIFNRRRRLAFCAAVNYDPTARAHKREKDRWFFDPRVPQELQAGESLYAGNPLDRGHLVRRADAGWGSTAAEAKLANDDTFHFTNCSPQHEITNQGLEGEAPEGLKLWGSLEEFISAQGKQERSKLCVFNGPVFRPDDRKYRGLQLPREFWKLVAYPVNGAVRVAAFILSQAQLIDDLKEGFDFTEYRPVQVTVSELEARTKLDFGALAQADALNEPGSDEAFADGAGKIVLSSLQQIRL